MLSVQTVLLILLFVQTVLAPTSVVYLIPCFLLYAVLGNFVSALNRFVADHYSSNHSVSEYHVYEFFKVMFHLFS